MYAFMEPLYVSLFWLQAASDLSLSDAQSEATKEAHHSPRTISSSPTKTPCAQSQTAATAYFLSKQLLSFIVVTEQHRP